MALTPLRIAAAGGSVDGHPATALVAAGFTLLQRSAPLVRALAGRRSAILLADPARFLVALAASDGRGALVLDPRAPLAPQLHAGNVGAVLTTRALSAQLGDIPITRVLLDDAPLAATVISTVGAAQAAAATPAGSTSVRVDLGSHFGLALEALADEPGRPEECVLFADGSVLTHRALLDGAPPPGRSSAQGHSSDAPGARGHALDPTSARGPDPAPFDVSSPSAFVATFIAPLLAGAVLTHR